ncbi:hypothetical protein KKE19_02940 [Patescibacteria group bacterium]|nr:hypothetical protein [Patescibacteria group bacterium]MBU4367809.1 hypothetical protein [Patescibacteria group bacterium]MBU4461519.1 hypothetical protein [Patescibacteria group bacterium]MCG2700340.1 hypothetical protein [Candidatus Parcubacteria bacterium]
MDENFSIRVHQLKQICQVRGGNSARTVDKQERAKKMENYVARITGNHCIFSDKTVQPGTFDLKLD